MDTKTNSEDLAVRVRDIVRTLKHCGIGHAEAAAAIGVSERTLKAYRSTGSDWRRISHERLERLNRMADEAVRSRAALVERLAA